MFEYCNRSIENDEVRRRIRPPKVLAKWPLINAMLKQLDFFLFAESGGIKVFDC